MTITLPDDPALLSNVGAALRQRNDFAQAEACLNRALSLNLALAEAWNNLGQVCEDTHRFAEALVSCTNAYSLRRTHPNISLSSRTKRCAWANGATIPGYRPARHLEPSRSLARGTCGNRAATTTAHCWASLSGKARI